MDDILTWWQGLFELPCVAIGGITAANARGLADAGADFVAVSGGVWSGDSVARIRALAAALDLV